VPVNPDSTNVFQKLLRIGISRSNTLIARSEPLHRLSSQGPKSSLAVHKNTKKILFAFKDVEKQVGIFRNNLNIQIPAVITKLIIYIKKFRNVSENKEGRYLESG
jgi:hypothetical protein